jgi:hypothetical protein
MTHNDKEVRPDFERMISNLEFAKRNWDRPELRDYSKVMLRMVGVTALDLGFDPSSAKEAAE